MLKPYSELIKVDVLPFCEHRTEKGKKIPYLNWAKCIELLHEHGAESVYYLPMRNANGHSLFMSDQAITTKDDKTHRCYEVWIEVHIDDQTYTMSYPLINGMYPVFDDSISQRAIHTAQARAFVKCVAIRTGLGFSLWIKDDESTALESNDLSSHSGPAIRRRVEETMTRLLQKGMDEKVIFEKIGTNKKSFDLMLRAHTEMDKVEKILNKL